MGGTGPEYFFLLSVSHTDIRNCVEIRFGFKKTGQRVLSQYIKSGSAPGEIFTGRLFWKMILSMRPGLRDHYRKIVVCVHMSCGTRREMRGNGLRNPPPPTEPGTSPTVHSGSKPPPGSFHVLWSRKSREPLFNRQYLDVFWSAVLPPLGNIFSISGYFGNGVL